MVNAKEPTQELSHRLRAAVSPPSARGGAIRITGYSLLAVGAAALTLLLTRQRPERPTLDERNGEEEVPAVQELDAIRSAGF